MVEEKSAVIKEIESILQPELFIEDMAVNGLQVEGRKKEVAQIATAVTASEYVIDKAIEYNADLLLVHHGLFLKGGVGSIKGALGRKVEKLLTHGITLAGYHLPLDAHPHFGNAWVLPLDMQWLHIEPFCTYKGGISLGTIAQLPEERTALELYESLRTYWKSATPPTFVQHPEKVVKKVAFIPGGGHKWLYDAVKAGADCFITGTFDEPVWHIANEENIAFMAFGHHSTERGGVKKLGEYLSEKCGIHHVFIDEMNPY